MGRQHVWRVERRTLFSGLGHTIRIGLFLYGNVFGVFVAFRSNFDRYIELRVVACITVRTGSKRLPRKALLKINGIETIRHLIRGVKRSKLLKSIILCTTSETEDVPLTKIADQEVILFHRGSTTDVMGRIIEAARRHNPDWIVRITGDDILVDGREIDMGIKELVRHKSNTYPLQYLHKEYPKGTDFQVIPFRLLEDLYERLRFNSKSDTEMIGDELKENCFVVRFQPEYSLDTKADYNRLKELLE